MIDVRELRVGNKVLFAFSPEQEKELVTVIWVSDDSVGYKEQHEASYPQSPKSFYGIPLTPEILEAAGLEQHENYFISYQNIDFKLWLDTGSMEFQYSKPNGLYIVIEYLHQLQNLHFALEGTELEIETEFKNVTIEFIPKHENH